MLPSCPFDPLLSIFNGLSVVKLKDPTTVTGITAATDTFTKTAHGLTVGRALEFVSGTGFTGLTAGTVYYVIAAPTADTFKLAATYGGATALTPGTSTVGVFAPVTIIEAPQLDDDPEQDAKPLPRPGFDGVMRNVRYIRTKSNDKFSFPLDEPRRLPAIFNGKMHGRVTKLATIWIPDVEDATNKCALKSQDNWECSVTRDGKVTHGNGDYSKGTIRLESTEGTDLTWTPDATV